MTFPLHLSHLLLSGLGLLSGLCALVPDLAAQTPTARLIHLTVDGKAGSASLLPGFRTHSCWSGLGVSSRGDVYMTASNHLQSGGNAAICKYDPVADKISVLGDLKSISTAANNWMPGESQHKVHTFLMEHADGKIYLASDDYDPSPFLRGAHVYTIDPATDQVVDFSKTQPFLMTKNLNVIANTGKAEERSGVFIEFYGIKGLSLNPRAPGVIYAMTYPDGHLIRYDTGNGAMQVVGQSKPVSYVFYTDNSGNAYYAKESGSGLSLVKYELATGNTTVVKSFFLGIELGAIAPTQSGNIVYCLEAATQKIYRLDCSKDSFTEFTTVCGTNWWQLYNLSLSPDGRSLYFVSNNNDRSTIRKIDLATKQCSEFLDINALLGSRDLCFGGVNVWDDAGNFYAPVWTYPDKSDLALLKVSTNDLPLESSPATLSVASGGSQTMNLNAGPDNANEEYLVLGSISGTQPGFEIHGLTLPLGYPDIYFDYTAFNPNSSFLPSSLGRLDSSGAATTSFQLPAGFNPSLIGLQLHHAFGVLDSTVTVVFTSNATPLTLVP